MSILVLLVYYFSQVFLRDSIKLFYHSFAVWVKLHRSSLLIPYILHISLNRADLKFLPRNVALLEPCNGKLYTNTWHYIRLLIGYDMHFWPFVKAMYHEENIPLFSIADVHRECFRYRSKGAPYIYCCSLSRHLTGPCKVLPCVLFFILSWTRTLV